MKKAIYILIALLMIATVAIAGCTEKTTSTTTSTSSPTTTATTEPAKPIELRLSWVETNNPLYQNSHGKFVNAVHERTGGRVKITAYFAGQLVPPPENYDAVIKGTHDIGVGWIALHTGRFPSLEVVALTRLDTDYAAVNSACNELFKTTPEVQAEFAETKVLALSNSGNSGLGFANNEVRTMENLKGLKIHVVSKYEARLIEELGGAPMTMMPSELYTNLQRKIIDGGSFEPEMLYAINLQEVVKYWTKVPTMTMAIYTAMNKDKWSSLPPDIQKIIEDAALEFIPAGYQNHFLDESPLDAAAEKYGLTVIELAPEELARWVEVQEGVRGEWVAEMEAKGLPGKKILEDYDRLCEKYATK